MIKGTLWAGLVASLAMTFATAEADTAFRPYDAWADSGLSSATPADSRSTTTTAPGVASGL